MERNTTASFTANRLDILWLNLYVVPRAKASWITVAGITIVFIVLLWWLNQPRNAALVAFTLIFGPIVGLFALVASVCSVILRADKRSGVLGARSTTITAEGLITETTVTSSVIKWSAISSILKTKRYIFFKYTSRGYFIVPKRAFESSAEYEAFWENVVLFRSSAIGQASVPPDDPAAASRRQDRG